MKKIVIIGVAAVMGLMVRAEKCADGNAVLQQINVAMKQGGGVVELKRGDYHFYPTSVVTNLYISNHTHKEFRNLFIDLTGATNLVLRGDGTRFVFHGAGLGMLLRQTQNVHLENIELDWARPLITEARITGFEDGATLLTVDGTKFPYKFEGGKFIACGDGWQSELQGGMLFDGITHEIIERTQDISLDSTKVKAQGAGLRAEYDWRKVGRGAKVGDIVAMRPRERPCPAVVVTQSKNTSMRNVNIATAWGMGVICQKSENFTFEGGGMMPPKCSGRITTAHADALHMSNVKGMVRVEGAQFEGMMDDALNVHSTCLGIVEVASDRRKIRAKYMHHEATGFGVFSKGERLRFIKGKTLENKNETVVMAVEELSATEVWLTLADEAPADLGVGDAVENADYQCAVIFRNNVVKNNRARGVLFTTPYEVVCESNKFLNVSGSAILLAGDAQGWYESGACSRVVVRGNLFRNCLTSVFQFCEAIISVYPMVKNLEAQQKMYHGELIVEDNVFETFDVPLLSAISLQSVQWRNNRIKENTLYAPWHKAQFIFNHCAAKDIQ